MNALQCFFLFTLNIFPVVYTGSILHQYDFVTSGKTDLVGMNNLNGESVETDWGHYLSGSNLGADYTDFPVGGNFSCYIVFYPGLSLYPTGPTVAGFNFDDFKFILYYNKNKEIQLYFYDPDLSHGCQNYQKVKNRKVFQYVLCTGWCAIMINFENLGTKNILTIFIRPHGSFISQYTYDTSTDCAEPFLLSNPALFRQNNHNSYFILDELIIHSGVNTLADFEILIVNSGLDSKIYPYQNGLQERFDLLTDSYQASFVENDPIANYFVADLIVHSVDNWELKLQFRLVGGNKEWQIFHSDEGILLSHSSFIEPTFGEFFYVSYAVLPISATQFYVYFQLKESIKVYVLITPNKAYSYHGVDMFIGKFNGHINLFDIYNMAAINYIIDHNYWYICRLYNEPRMACDCGINKYVHYNGGCSDCVSPCTSCLIYEHSCTACDPPYFRYNNKFGCSNSQPSHYLFLNGLWTVCHSNCNNCENITTNCTDCFNELYLLKDTNKCITSCEVNDYYIVESDKQCFRCFEGCTGCRSPGTFEDCVECADGYSKYYPDNIIDSTFECLNECPISYYPDLSNVCQDCDPSCNECDGLSKMDCINCSPTCPILCYNCTSHTSCQSCLVPEIMNINSNGICECNSGYIIRGNKCIKCHPNCEECFGLTKYECSGCKNNTITHINYQQTYCFVDCKEDNVNVFHDTRSNMCVGCTFPCKECFGTEINQCLNCANDYFMYEGYCLVECPISTYLTPDYICANCPILCQDCINQGEICTSCLPQAFHYDYSCVEECPDYTYRENNTSYICLKCDRTCRSCLGESEKECKECKKDLVFENSLCIPRCSNSLYLNMSINTCLSCHASCLTCNGPTQNNCTSCSAGQSLSESICVVIICNRGEYYNKKRRACDKCNILCKECNNSPKECIDCPEGRALNIDKCVECSEADPRLAAPQEIGPRGMCGEVCGDGFNMGINQCDDGNTVSGDGCDNKCNVETGFRCAGGGFTASDYCRYIISPTFSLSWGGNLTLILIFDHPLHILNGALIQNIVSLLIQGPKEEYIFSKYVDLALDRDNILKNLDYYLLGEYFNTLYIYINLETSIFGEEKETLYINLLNCSLILDEYNNTLDTCQAEIFLNKFIYINKKAKETSDKAGKGIEYGSMITFAISIIIQMAFGSALEHMLNLLNFLQIIYLIPFMELNLPPFLVDFLTDYLGFTNLRFDFIPNPFFELFKILDNDPINPRFANNGYKSKSILLLYGQQILYMIIYLMLWPVAKFLNFITKGKYSFIRKWKISYKYNGLISFFSFSYLPCCLVTLISIHQLEFIRAWQFYVSASFSVIFLVFIGRFPFIINNILFNLKLKYQRRWFQRQFGSLTKEFNFKSRKVGSKYFFHVLVLSRKFIHVAIITNIYQYPVIQLVSINILTFLLIVWDKKNRPMISPYLQFPMIVGEICILTIHIILFAYIEESRITDKQGTIFGFIIIGIIILVFILNIVAMVLGIISHLRKKGGENRGENNGEGNNISNNKRNEKMERIRITKHSIQLYAD